MALTPFEQEVGIIYDFLDEVYPDAQIMQPYAGGDINELSRLYQAGLGLAEVTQADGSTDIVTYVRDENHVVVRALFAIAEAENAEEIPAGSHDIALDSIKYGMPFPMLKLFIDLQP